jgi:hypothetical protein
MELVTYLNEHFLTLSSLLEQSKTSESELRRYQEQGVMPRCSYTISLAIDCDSYFGDYHEKQVVEYYPKGYVAWLGMLQSLGDANESDIVACFKSRYLKTINKAAEDGFQQSAQIITAVLDEHIQQEWAHFLNGTYGLCTKSGLPEDIAIKELAIIEINALLSIEVLDDRQLSQLKQCVNRLDEVSALFAPHERASSSRQRLIEDIRRTYSL